MENLHEKVVKLTAEILKKSWTPDPGKVTPFSSSSSQHDEESDNHLEYYVKKDPKTPLHEAIANIFNSNFWTNGGEKMTDKALDVDSSTTQQQQYENPGTSTTEPDPQSNIAITKAAEMQPTSVGTTANTTTEAPAGGETTEPTTKAADADEDDMKKSEDCASCGKSMSLCECSGMSKAEGDKCPSCGQAIAVKKAADEPESKEEAAKETPEDEKAEMKKSLWGGAFAPVK